jgi:hypothetical protein
MSCKLKTGDWCEVRDQNKPVGNLIYEGEKDLEIRAAGKDEVSLFDIVGVEWRLIEFMMADIAKEITCNKGVCREARNIAAQSLLVAMQRGSQSEGGCKEQKEVFGQV